MLAKAILTEIYMALRNLKEKEESHTIYISKFDLSKEDKELLNSILQDGVITVEDNSNFQKAKWVETTLSGVWKGVIYDLQGTPVVETIEISFFPSLASSQKDEIIDSIKSLKELLKVKGEN